MSNHVQYMKSERNTAELIEYIERLYFTALNKDVALDYSKRQVSVIQKELQQTRSRLDDDKKALADEVDQVKEQIAAMEENFLLWRTKVHNDQMAQQEDFLHERLVKQDRIEELEEDLNNSQDEATRLRDRLLILEYEDGYVGPSSLLPESGNYNLNDDTLSLNDPSTSVMIEYGPMTVASHKRRSGDFKSLEMKAKSLEAQIQILKKALETERQERQTDVVDFKTKMQQKCAKLEQEVQAAKMESTMYTEMMHEIVTENDDLRKQVKNAHRKIRRQRSSVSSSKSGKSRSQDYYGYSMDEASDSVYGSEDDMEDVII
ncbi:hypothetical protein EDD21DRAFT_365085 [Dissophora ornata]|nr:hypothetical protein EDD21DRAFT_365085 [Dissophora ornata]